MNQKNVWRLKRPYQTHSHNLYFKITGLARMFFPRNCIHYCDILLRNVEGKKVCPFLLLENSRPLSPWGPLDFLSTCLGIHSLTIRQTYSIKLHLTLSGDLSTQGSNPCLLYFLRWQVGSLTLVPPRGPFNSTRTLQIIYIILQSWKLNCSLKLD